MHAEACVRCALQLRRTTLPLLLPPLRRARMLLPSLPPQVRGNATGFAVCYVSLPLALRTGHVPSNIARAPTDGIGENWREMFGNVERHVYAKQVAVAVSLDHRAHLLHHSSRCKRCAVLS